MEYWAKHDFTASKEDELSFKKGTILKVLGESDPNWLIAEKDGREGVIPANYVQAKDCSWYRGRIKRQEAEDELAAASEGAFLIRESESAPGDFSLSVKYPDSVEHHKILRDGAGKYFLWVVKFNSLNQLVEYHRTSSVSRSQNVMLKFHQVECVGLYDFTGKDATELAFKKGDVITITSTKNADWWEGEMTTGAETKRGMFPKTYVKMR